MNVENRAAGSIGGIGASLERVWDQRRGCKKRPPAMPVSGAAEAYAANLRPVPGGAPARGAQTGHRRGRSKNALELL